jgi:hypothetical protein
MRITSRRRSRLNSNVWAGKLTSLVGNYVTVDNSPQQQAGAVTRQSSETSG